MKPDGWVKKMSVFPDVRYCIYAAKIGSKKVTKKANVIYGKIKLAKPINLPTIQYIAKSSSNLSKH